LLFARDGRRTSAITYTVEMLIRSDPFGPAVIGAKAMQILVENRDVCPPHLHSTPHYRRVPVVIVP